MDKLFNVSIVTPEKTVYEGKIVSLVVPSESGYMGVLANHASLIANLVKGRITLKDPSGLRRAFSINAGGVIEVLKNNVTILSASIS